MWLELKAFVSGFEGNVLAKSLLSLGKSVDAENSFKTV